jgi:hypothetical protein
MPKVADEEHKQLGQGFISAQELSTAVIDLTNFAIGE